MNDRTETIRAAVADFLADAPLTREQFDDPYFPYDLADEISEGWAFDDLARHDQPDRDELIAAARAYLATLERDKLSDDFPSRVDIFGNAWVRTGHVERSATTGEIIAEYRREDYATNGWIYLDASRRIY